MRPSPKVVPLAGGGEPVPVCSGCAGLNPWPRTEVVGMTLAAAGWQLASICGDGSVDLEPIAGWAQVRCKDRCGCTWTSVLPLTIDGIELIPASLNATYGNKEILAPGQRAVSRKTPTGGWYLVVKEAGE
jgi:hypothetical protein